eukprot:TRINITY_DN10820_c0_g1_i1.p1 TRINITY_DN10820_c0_g1~~TRINITY_DN10820_c0_g1_i1.p1  ORF type:complete len:190 (-),score=-19.73 TRINITY_DN10820_c0_g1_i1:250-819(-)
MCGICQGRNSNFVQFKLIYVLYSLILVDVIIYKNLCYNNSKKLWLRLWLIYIILNLIILLIMRYQFCLISQYTIIQKILNGVFQQFWRMYQLCLDVQVLVLVPFQQQNKFQFLNYVPLQNKFLNQQCPIQQSLKFSVSNSWVLFINWQNWLQADNQVKKCFCQISQSIKCIFYYLLGNKNNVKCKIGCN